MTKKIKIPEVEIEIGPSLYLQIKDVSFIPATPGRYLGPPEDCYPEEPAECDWLKENAKIVIKRCEYTAAKNVHPSVKKITVEKEFEVDDSFVYEYYDQIIEAIEEI